MKKAYTLIELIIVLAIIATMSSVTIISFSRFQSNMNKIKLESLENEIKSLLSFAKAYCRKNKVPGEIYISDDKKSINFEVREKEYATRKKIVIEDNISVSSNLNENTVVNGNNIDENGYIKSAGTITVLDDRNNKFEITIGVGNDIIRSY